MSDAKMVVDARTPLTDCTLKHIESQSLAYQCVALEKHARDLERELYATRVCAGVASLERGEWGSDLAELGECVNASLAAVATNPMRLNAMQEDISLRIRTMLLRLGGK